MTAPEIDFAIEEVVLHGFRSMDGEAVGRLLERELTRLIARRGVPSALSRGGATQVLEGLSFDLVPNAGASALAGQLARALYGGLVQ